MRQRYVAESLDPIEEERIEIDVPEDAHLERPPASKSAWQLERWNRPPSASAAAAALRWEETHPDG